ncbi:hypothetical protein GF362_06055 [Candidatus Dojkabacteria bacterium]|nr:hypothetical protein [Candidatus Dojkabacteria bacterium]
MTEKTYENKKKYLIIIGIGFAVLCLCIFSIIGIFYKISGWGKCRLGEQLYLKGSINETCARIGTKIDPLPDSSAGKLTITVTPWTGWDDGALDQEVFTYKISSADDYELPELEKFKIIKHNKSEIEIKIDNLAVKQGADLDKTGINLNDCKVQTVTIKKGERIEADTCTMDGGVNWEIKYE